MLSTRKLSQSAGNMLFHKTQQSSMFVQTYNTVPGVTTPLAAVVPLVLIGALQDSLSGYCDPFSTAEAAVLWCCGPPTGGACGILGLVALRITKLNAATVDSVDQMSSR